MEYEEALMVKIAWYYYIEKMTQQKISEMMGISRIRVIKLLDKAYQTGIIQFKIREDSVSRVQSEKQLIQKFGLSDAFVVPAVENPELINESVAKAAAMYISDRAAENSFINIGYGDTLGKVMNNLVKQVSGPTSFVTLTGGVNNYLHNLNESLNNVTLHITPAPLIASSKEMVSAMREESSVKEISRLVRLSSMTILGIGNLDDNSTVVSSGLLNKNDLVYLKRTGVVGDILCHFIDKNGNLVPTSIEDRLISTPLDTIKELENVIAVAAGESKAEAIKAALKGNYIDILITDEVTALKLGKDD